MKATSYVYIYTDPARNNEPIYVGKGTGLRAWSHLRRTDEHPSTHRLQKMAKNDVSPRISIYADLEDEFALLLEQELISLFGRKDLNKGPLLNLTDGGDGAAGKIVSDKTKKLISRVRTGEKRSLETRRRISEAKHGQKYSEQARKNISEGHKGIDYPIERNKKISEALQNHAVSQVTREKISAKAKLRVGAKNSMFGKTQSAEARRKLVKK